MMVAARRATVDDLGSLVGLAAAFREELEVERGGWLWLRRDPSRSDSLAELGAALAAPHALVVVGTIDDVVLGYAVVRIAAIEGRETVGVVSDLFVEELARDVGVGAVLIQAVLAWCDERGCVGVDATALPGMRETKNFFEAWGFTARALIVHRSLRTRPEAGAVSDVGVAEKRS